MYQPFVLLAVIASCVVAISDVHLVSGVIYHPPSAIQQKILESVPVISKGALVPSEVAYSFGIQGRSLHYTERDVANGYASQVLSCSVAFSIPELHIEQFVPKESTVQSVPLLSYALNAKPVVSQYTTIAKSLNFDAVPRFSRILTGSHLDNTYGLNVLPSEPSEISTEIVKKAPLYTEAIFKPWPRLQK